MTHIFAACRKFDPLHGEGWSEYVHWSGYHQVREVVSIDCLLCPSLIDELLDDDWNYNIHADNRIHFFHDYKYLARRVGFDTSTHNILALTENPTAADEVAAGFTFSGYDILDSDDSISVLLNCGSFPSVFAADEVNQVGLLDSLERANQIAGSIRASNPSDRHCCECRVWGIARYSDTAITTK